MKNKAFSQRYAKFIDICKGVYSDKELIPYEQIFELEYNPRINPNLQPPPREWLIESFDWFVALRLIPGNNYGPFCRVDGNYFWPEIGNIYGLYTEKKCFYGLKMPINADDVERLYKPKKETLSDFVYGFTIKMPIWPIEDNAYIFIGEDKEGEGYIMNPNSKVATIIRNMITKKKVIQYAKDRDGNYDYRHGKKYDIKKLILNIQ